MDLKIGRALGEEVLNGLDQSLLEIQPHRFGNDERGEDEDRLLRVREVRSGVSRFVEINEVHGR